jgi:Family of unknown function (DUF6152)
MAMRNASAGCPAPVGLVPLLVLTAALWPGTAPAHHSFASIYDTGKSVTVTGSVREFQFVHPHPFLVVEVRSKSGERQTWRAEMDNRFELEEIGMTENTFRPGDEVVVSGSPGRTQSSIIYMWKLERAADGLLYRQTGGTPSLNKVPLADSK